MDCDAISQGIAGGIFNIIKQAYTGDLCEDNQLNGKQFGAGAKTSLDSGAKEWVRVGESASADQITKWAFIFFQVLIHLDTMWRLLWCWGVCAHASTRKETRGMSETRVIQ